MLRPVTVTRRCDASARPSRAGTPMPSAAPLASSHRRIDLGRDSLACIEQECCRRQGPIAMRYRVLGYTLRVTHLGWRLDVDEPDRSGDRRDPASTAH